MTPGEFRLRITYAKKDRLRWLSHLEIVRATERLIRRSGLPYAVTQGFSPHMKLAFGPALPVGTEGTREYADVWLTRYTRAQDALEQLVRVSADDLSPFEAAYVSERSPSLSAALTIGKYRIELHGKDLDATAVRGGLTSVLGSGQLEIEHKGKTKVFDLARCVPEDPRVSVAENGVEVELAIRMGSQGSLRPEALVKAAIAGIEPEVSAVRTTRLDLLAEDENGVWSRPV